MSPSTLIGASRSCRTREKKIIKNCFNHGNITDTTQTQSKTLSCTGHTCGIKFSPLLSLVFSNHVNGSIDGGTHFGYKWQNCLHNRTCTTFCMCETCDGMFVFGRSSFSLFLFALVTYIMIKRYAGVISSIWSHHNVRFTIFSGCVCECCITILPPLTRMISVIIL